MSLRDRIFSIGLYFSTGVFALILALWLTTSFLKGSEAQDSAVPPPPAPSTENASDPASSEEFSAPPGTPLQAAAPPVAPQDVPFLEPYVYDLREGRRNPFKAPPTIDGTEVEAGTFPGLELERFELDEIKLVAIMWDIRAPKAMFLDPNGQVHTLGKDDRIGRKRGYIAAIREGEVVVVETSNFSGEAVYSSRVLRIDR